MNTKEPNFSVAEELLICQEYNDGLSTLKLAKRHGCTWDATINKILKKHGVARRDRSHQRRVYEINERFFDQIASPETAYCLGLLYADGGRVNDTVYLSLMRADEQHLHVIASLLGTNKPIKQYTNNFGRPYSRLDITNKHMVEKLATYGIVPRKTHKIRFPPWLSQNLHSHFIRGYFDGDGGLTIQKKRNKANLTFTSNRLFCHDLRSILTQELSISGHISKVKKKKIYRLTICGNRQILRLLDWMYYNQTVCLGRKLAKYHRLKLDPISRQPQVS